MKNVHGFAIRTSTTRDRYSRRSFLGSIGGGLALVPLLNGQRADAAAAPIKRLFTFFWANGMPQQSFWPAGTGDLVLSPVLKGLEPVKDYTTVVAACDLQCVRDSGGGTYNGHAANPGVLTGKRYSKYNGDSGSQAGGDSVDQFIGGEFSKKFNTPLRCVVAGVQGGADSVGAISYRGAGSTGIAPERDPVALYKALFAGKTLPAGMVDTSLARRKSILDVVGGQIEAFATRLGTDDRSAVQAHLETIRDIEKQLSQSGGGGAAGCASPTSPAGGLTSNDRIPDCFKVQADLILAAFKCDITRVATFQFSDAYGGITFSWLGSEFTGNDDISGNKDNIPSRDHHGLAHHEGFGPDEMSRFVRANGWFYEQVSYVAQKMKATNEGGSTMLDNSLIASASNCKHNHVIDGVPWVLVGKAGGYFKTGRLARIGNCATRAAGDYWGGQAGSSGVSNARMLLTICHAMDLPIPSFGDGGTNPIAELKA